ncbi:MAG TPA: tRNA-dihydrouridine synthase family protein [Tepidisphaeraceae bacterium]|nr:tRNA-dihydrouridine synthase family protein [Tepidisphaeraceae bacterium]
MNIGPFQFSSPFCQAGLAGYSDRAMRLVARRHGCPYAVTEALLDTILLNGGEGLRKSIDISADDHPVAGQIMGSGGEEMAEAAKILASAGFDVIDLNFACPVKKIKNKARGGHMLLDADRGIDVLKAVRDALPPQVPTSISLRRGFDDSAQSRDRFYRIVDEAFAYGYSAVRVHGRTVEQKYAGQAHWPFLREVKRRYPDRTILGSGDVFTAQDAVRMLRETAVDMVWIARGAIGNPWIFRHAVELLRREDQSPQMELLPPSIPEQRAALAEHFGIAMQIHGESLAGRRMRKMGIKYSRFHPESALVKSDFIAVHSLRDWTGVLEKWYAQDAPGIWPDPKSADEVNAAPEGCAVGS